MTLPRPALPRHHRAQVNFSGTVGDVRFEEPGDPATVLRVLYLVYNEGYTGDVDLAAEAIRLTGELSSMTDDEETAGLLALILLHHGRRPARTRRDGSLVPLARQDRSRWNTSLIAERASQSCRQRWAATDSVTSKPRPLRRPARQRAARQGDRLGADRRLVGRAAPAHRQPGLPLNRAVALGEADGPVAGLAAPATVDPAPPHRRLGVPPREGGRPSDHGTVVRRRRPVHPPPRRAPPPHRQAARADGLRPRPSRTEDKKRTPAAESARRYMIDRLQGRRCVDR